MCAAASLGTWARRGAGRGPARAQGAKLTAVSAQLRGRFAGARITRGALIVLGLEVGLSLVWLLADPLTQRQLEDWLMPSPRTVLEHGRVWTLATGLFLERRFVALLFHGLVLWSFVPMLERFWGTARFYRFVAITGLASSVAAVGAALAFGASTAAVSGLDALIFASIVAFGVVYARQPVQFFGVLPLTGRQLMYGILGFVAFSVLVRREWIQGAAFAAAMVAAALLTSRSWSPAQHWKRWRIARARARLKVVSGGQAAAPRKPRDEQTWLN